MVVLDIVGLAQSDLAVVGHGREYWGLGYATEAAAAVRDWALSHLDLKRLIALIYPANTQSIAVALKLGMKPDGEVEIFGSRVTRYALGKRPAR